MQSLFSLNQSREANYELGIEMFNEFFAPDLNSMEVQDKPLLNSQKRQAVKLFQRSFETPDTDVETDDVKVKKAVNSAIQEYNKQVKKDRLCLQIA